MRNITNTDDILSSRSIDNGGDLNQLTADLPLNLILDETTNDSINLGGLNSYGGAGKIIKVNSNNDGLVYADDNNTEYTVVSPLTISNNAISLSTLNGFGGAGKILKVNINNNAFEYADETDTTYTVALPLTLSAQNKIGIASLTSYGTDNQILRMNGTTSIEWSNEQDISGFITTATLPNLVAALTTFGSDSAGLTNFGATNYSTNLYGNVIIKNITTVNNGNLYVYGSGGLITASTYSYSFPVGGGTLVSSNTLPSSISVLNNFGTSAISNVSLGKIGLDTLIYGNIKIQNISNVSSGNIFICGTNNIINKSTQSYTLPSSTGTLALTSDIPSFVNYFAKTNNDIRPINTTDNLLIGTTLNPNLRKVVIEGLTIEDPYFHYGALEIKNSSIFFTTGGGMIVNDAGQAVISRTSGENIFGENSSINTINGSTSTTFKGSSNVVQIESTLRFTGSGGMIRNSQGNAIISYDATPNAEKNTFGISANITEILGSTSVFSARIETSSDLKFTGSGGMIRNNQGDAIIQRNNGLNKNIFGVLGDITEILGSKMTFSSDSLNYLNYDSNIGGKIGINLIGNYALKMGLSGTPTGSNEASIILEGQNVNVVGDIKTLDDVFCEGSIRIISPAAFLPAPETQYDNYINYGLGYATGPDIHGYRGVKLWARDSIQNIDDIRFYVSSGVCNMRVPYALINGSVVQTSDDRLKTDEIDFTFNSLEIINKMKPKQYKKYNENGEFLYMELGMVAQDTFNSVKDIELLRDIFVNKIDYNLESNFKEDGDLIEDQQKIGDNGEIETNYLYVNYISYIPILIQSIKDLNSIVKQQQVIIDKLVNSTSYKNFKSSI